MEKTIQLKDFIKLFNNYNSIRVIIRADETINEGKSEDLKLILGWSDKDRYLNQVVERFQFANNVLTIKIANPTTQEYCKRHRIVYWGRN